MADIYLALHAYGPQSISALARRSGVERTRIYRLMDKLKSSTLIEVETHNKYSIFRAAPITNLQVLISKKEQEVRDLQSELVELHRALHHSKITSAVTRVQMYQGLDGIKQMMWNQTHTKGENLSILYENMQGRTKESFFVRWARACNEADIQFRGIVGDHFVKTQQQWYDGHTNERLKKWKAGYLPSSIYPITHSTIIYNDVTGYFNWKGGEIFGLEITNQEIADSQRKLFEMLWAMSIEIDDLKGFQRPAS